MLKVATAVLAAVMDTVQAHVPEHAPDQPEKVDPFADAVSVTTRPES